jgi:PAS domain S-box-containing protein
MGVFLEGDCSVILRKDKLPPILGDRNMKDESMTKEQLMQELAELRQRVAEMEKSEAERKRVEEALQKSEEYFRAITEHSSDIIFIVDKKGTITYASPSIERFIGYKPEELIGKTGFDFILPADLPRAIYDFGKAILTKEVVIPNAFRVKHKDGSERVLEGVGKNLLDNSAVAGFVMNVRDVSERKRIEEEREKLVGELQKALSDVKKLSGFLPICASCKKIRDDKGYWRQIEAYIRDHSEAEFSHGLCPDCAKKLYG